MSIVIPNIYTQVDGFDSYINTTGKELQRTLRKWKASWIYAIALPHHHNEADLQLARIERDNAKLIDTIALTHTLEFQIQQVRRFSGIAQDEQERAQEAAFKLAKWDKKSFNTHNYKEIEMAVLGYIKLITAKHYEHLCMGINVTQEDCGSQVLVRLDTNLASRSDGTIRDIKTKYVDAVANFDKNKPVQWFGNILRQQQVPQFYRISTTTIKAMEDAVHRIQACIGQSSGFSIEIATWRITIAATKATGTVLTDDDEVLSFDAMLRAYNEKTKRSQANNRPTGGGHFKPLYKALSTDAREPCQWCPKNLNKTFLHREQDCCNKNRPPLVHQAHGDKSGREPSACFICKRQGHRAAACPQAANFQAIIQQQQGKANLAAHQAAHDSVDYRVMIGESAVHSSMSTTVSNDQSPAASRQAGAGGFYFWSLTQLDGCSPTRSSPSASPFPPCTPPTPSTPSGTWHPQL